jgi:hypothetical protein
MPTCTNPMTPTLRFNPGDIAFVRPATPDYRVTLIEPITRVAANGIVFPCWLVSDDTGRVFEKMQIELSSRPVSIVRGAARLMQGEEWTLPNKLNKLQKSL